MSALCVDCGLDTTPCEHVRGCRHRGRWEFYMVRDAVWVTAGMTSEAALFRALMLDLPLPGMDEFLCVGCIEARLGRQLTAADFTGAPINESSPWDTPRLAARKAA